MPNFFTVSIVAEVICFLVAVICLLRARSLVWRSMVLYLLLTCVNEIAGKYIGKRYHNNQWLYNIFIFFEAGFTFTMLANLLGKYVNCKPIIIPGFAIFIVSHIYGLINPGFLSYDYVTCVIMSAMFVLYSLYYYYLLLKDDLYVDLKYSPEFWWVAGTLLFYFGDTGCNIFSKQLETITIGPNKGHLTYLIFKVLNIILYGCWSYAFICKKWLTTTSEV
ncbi:MAG: hypothetical protein JWQ34_3620 [Mucilaginibacter sp.]|uniref:hypothetical protein n=1 Tax=Mucilaginibacter sp. TaxID=1882438 RepID=UPI002638E2BA|nr:hypothetical protein [Mucilaginibacter sp.]MDB5005395.1 hypothetical protein [Mucilaginibacter sp.]